MKKVAIVILNWNGKKWLHKFLPSLLEHTPLDLAEIIVADNASTDHSVDFLNQHYPNIQQIHLDKNYGFTGGYNRALARLEHEYFVLLNSDIEVSKHWLEPIIQRMDHDHNIAACQPKILSYNQKDHFEYAGASGGMMDWLGYPFCRGRIFHTSEKDEGQYNDARKIFWATGACMFVRGKVYHKMGGLDEHFFAHMEEIDLCWRMQNEGYDIWVDPKSVVYHVGGGTLQSDNPRKTYYNFRNNLLLIIKNQDFTKAYFIIFLRLILDGIAGLQFLFQGKFAHTWAIVQAHFAFYVQQFQYQKYRSQHNPLKSIYPNSILWAYFVKGKKKFRDLG
jgi:GT2 family glycosyltransferase